MRLIQQHSLTFSRAGSNKVKVFEIDLCEVGTGRFVVNYRYGRQGHPLRDGTRTLSPVDRTEADQTLARLLNDKLRSGYQLDSTPAGTPAPAPTAPPVTPAPSQPHQPNPVWTAPPRPTDGPDVSGATSREEAILRWLDWHRAPPAGAQPKWPLHRVAWRAGELRLTAATPHLIALLSGEHGPDYAITWALGRCGGDGAVATLRGLAAHSSPSVQNIATSSLSMLLTGTERDAWRSGLLEALPQRLQSALGTGRIESIQGAVSADPANLLTRLYATGEGALRGTLLGLTAILSPARADDLAALRALLQLAEHHDDIALLSAVISRLESGEVALKATPRDKLLQRPWRILRRLRDDADPRWPEAAAAVLRVFSDAEHPHASQPGRLADHLATLAAAVPLGDDTIRLLTEARCQGVADAISARLAPADPEPAFLQSLLAADHAAVRATGRAALAAVSATVHAAWISEHYESLLAHTALIAACIGHPDPTIQSATRDLLVRSPLDAPARTRITQSALVGLIEGDVPDTTTSFAVQTLWLALPAQLRSLPQPTVAALVRSDTAALQDLGGTQLLSGSTVPDDLLDVLITSAHPDARAAGIRLLQRLSDGLLLQHEATILTLCADPDPVVRQGGAGLLGRLLIGGSGARIAATLLTPKGA
ncbi:MAG: hypothetical protein ACI8RZ_003823 [Myxococcota bacterium]|jgi:hypothetical protein